MDTIIEYFVVVSLFESLPKRFGWYIVETWSALELETCGMDNGLK